MSKKLIRWLYWPLSMKVMLIEAVILSAFFRMMIQIFSNKKIYPWLGKIYTEADEDLSLEKEVKVRYLVTVMEVLDRHVFWECTCLVQAFTAKIMLRQRKIPCTVYLGVARDEEKKLIAHAWTKAGDIYVTGGRAREGFTVTATFA